MRRTIGLVADEDQLVVGMGAGVVEGARDDLGRAVVAAHRVDGDADAAGSAASVGPAEARSPGQRAASSPLLPAGLSSIARRPW